MVSVNYGTGANGTRTVSVNTADGSGANTDPGTNNYTTFVVNTGITLYWGAAYATNYSKNIYCTTSATITGTLGAEGLGYYGGGGGGARGGTGGSADPGNTGNSPVAGGGGGGGSAGLSTGGGGGGGAHGGDGNAQNYAYLKGIAYGNAEMTVLYNGAGGGGGGGAHYEGDASGGNGGYGGGALQLCAPTLVINGLINLPGSGGGGGGYTASAGASGGGGGGGGGGCFIGTNSLSGTGSINCNGGGGGGGAHTWFSSGDGGGGGGGRIYIKKLNGTAPTLTASGGGSYGNYYNGSGIGATTALHVPVGVGSTIVWFYKQPSYSEFIVSNAQIPIEVNGVSWVFSYADKGFFVTDTTLSVVYNLGALYGKLSRTSKNFATYVFKNLFSSVSKIPKEIDIMGQNLDSIETRNIFDFFNAKFLI